MNKTYGYCRTSTNYQTTEHQKRQILSEYPSAIIYEDTYTGASIERPEFTKLLKRVEPGDTIVFVSVSRMSRNEAEGFELYEKLFNSSINLVFLNEHYIDTDTYKNALSSKFEKTGDNIDYVLEGINKYLIALAKDQMKELLDIRSRTKAGMQTAKIHGSQIGRKKGSTIVTEKKRKALATISKHSKDFGGSLSDVELIELTGLSRKTFYKYKKELRNNM